MIVSKKYLHAMLATGCFFAGVAHAGNVVAAPEKGKGEGASASLVPATQAGLEGVPAWQRNPVPADVARNYLSPNTSVGEDEDDWRPLFREKFFPLVKNCKTATEAVELLNREIWPLLGVYYNTGRDKPDQSPFHSMRIGKASCSGLSILLVDACRAVGVPARFVGCRWKNKPGNHSWVEFWDAGEWHFIDAGGGKPANKAWFEEDAAQADPADPLYAIYAACADETGLTFSLVWNPRSAVPAINVTARYLNAEKKLPPGSGRISVDLRSTGGARLAREILFLDAETGAELARGMTHGDGFDLNDHLRQTFPRGKKIKLVLAGTPERVLATVCVPAGEKTFSFVIES